MTQINRSLFPSKQGFYDGLGSGTQLASGCDFVVRSSVLRVLVPVRERPEGAVHSRAAVGQVRAGEPPEALRVLRLPGLHWWARRRCVLGSSAEGLVGTVPCALASSSS